MSNPVSPADFLDVRKQAHSFEKMGAAEAWGASLTGRETPEQISGLHLSEDMFPLLGVAPIRGRTFDAYRFRTGKEPGRGHRLRPVAAKFRRIGQRDRAEDSAGRRELHRDRRDAARFLFRAVLGDQRRNMGSSGFIEDVFRPGAANRVPSVTVTRCACSAAWRRARRGPPRKSEIDQICHSLAAAYPDTNVGMRLVVESLN